MRKGKKTNRHRKGLLSNSDDFVTDLDTLELAVKAWRYAQYAARSVDNLVSHHFVFFISDNVQCTAVHSYHLTAEADTMRRILLRSASPCFSCLFSCSAHATTSGTTRWRRPKRRVGRRRCPPRQHANVAPSPHRYDVARVSRQIAGVR